MNNDALKYIMDDENKKLGVRKMRYEFKYRGYEAFITRHQMLGHLNGFIQVGKYFDEKVEMYSHGGITFAEGGIIGFDCAHSGDLVPEIHLNNLTMNRSNDIYRNFNYVKSCIEDMIDYLVEKDEDNE